MRQEHDDHWDSKVQVPDSEVHWPEPNIHVYNAEGTGSGAGGSSYPVQKSVAQRFDPIKYFTTQ